MIPRMKDGSARPRPLLDLTSGYVQRATELLPKQGDRSPWRVRQNYVLDFLSAKFADFTESLEFPAPLESAGPSGDNIPAGQVKIGAAGGG